MVDQFSDDGVGLLPRRHFPIFSKLEVQAVSTVSCPTVRPGSQ
jgi:hypothetical protein